MLTCSHWRLRTAWGSGAWPGSGSRRAAGCLISVSNRRAVALPTAGWSRRAAEGRTKGWNRKAAALTRGERRYPLGRATLTREGRRCPWGREVAALPAKEIELRI